MAPERSLTPEKQLLKLIEDPKVKASTGIDAQAIKYHSQSLFSFGAWLGRLSFLKDRFKGWSTGEKSYFDLVKAINGILGLVIFILTFYFVSSISLALVNKKRPPELKSNVKQSAKQIKDPNEFSRLQPPAYYSEKISQRNIFRIGATKAADGQGGRGEVSKLVELTQNLKLVGISWSNDPDAMIEDTKVSRTFFVKRGQMIGELKVKDIARDKVVVSYGTEEVELR